MGTKYELESIPLSGAEELAAVRVAGEVDIDQAPDLRADLEKLLEGSCRHLVVDIDAVTHLDSFSLGAFVGVRQRARSKSGTVSFVCHNASLLRLFSITNLDKLFRFYESVDDFVQDRTAAPPPPVPAPHAPTGRSPVRSRSPH